MAKGISINFLANVKDVLRGTSDIEKAFDDVSSSLDDVARDGDRSAGRLGDSLSTEIEGGTKDGQASVERLEQTFKGLADTVRRETAASGDATSRNMKRGTDEASDGVKDLKEESASTAKEAAASFDGSADSIASAFQEVAANAFIGFGPAGLAAGLAAAAGLGLLIKAGQDSADSVNAAGEAVSSLTKELLGLDGDHKRLDVAKQIQDWSLELQDNKEWWEFWQEKATDNLDHVLEKSNQFGLNWQDVLRGMSGADSDAAVRVYADLDEQIAKAAATQELYANVTETSSAADLEAYSSSTSKLKALQDFRNELETSSGVTDDAIEKTKLLKEVTDADAEATDKATRAKERQEQAIDQINSSYDAAAGSIDDYIDKESGLFDTGKYIKAMREKRSALRDYQKDLASSGLSGSAKKFLEEQGAESAALMVAGYEKASPKQKKALAKIWTEAGRDNSAAYVKEAEDGISGKNVKGPKVDLEAPDVARLLRSTQSTLDARPPLKIRVDTVDRNGKKID